MGLKTTPEEQITSSNIFSKKTNVVRRKNIYFFVCCKYVNTTQLLEISCRNQGKNSHNFAMSFLNNENLNRDDLK